MNGWSAEASGAVADACALGLDIGVVSHVHVEELDRQLGIQVRGPGELQLLLNHGSEVFRVGVAGPELLERRNASGEEEAALDRAAAHTVELIAGHGLDVSMGARGLNRRGIDLLPDAGREDFPRGGPETLLEAVESRLRARGLDGLAAAIKIAEAAALAAGVEGARVRSDATHIEIGLTDKSDSARWWFAHLWRRGLWPEQSLVLGGEFGRPYGVSGGESELLIDAAAAATVVSVGVERVPQPAGVIVLGGGPAQLLRLLRTQVQLRRSGALPIVADDPRWTLRVDGVSHERERAHESLLTLADGRVGTRGSVLAHSPASRPGVVLAGAYSGEGERSQLQPAPLWNRLAPVGRDDGVARTLDLHAGLLVQQTPERLTALQFSSLAEPGLAVLRASGGRDELGSSPPLVPPGGACELKRDGEVMRLAVTDGVLEAAGAQSVTDAGGQAQEIPAASAALERIAAYSLRSHASTDPPAAQRLARARTAGSERLLIEHRCAWARRWEQADVRIEGDPELQRAVRLALFHLIGSAADGGEAPVGARGLTGTGYRGHVFWDSDVFVLPFLAATHPASARSILEYRVRRLPISRAVARSRGLRGARFAWESAASGEDVTPRKARDRAGNEVAIYTGEREEHIVADVAWAAACYIDWTGDEAFRAGPGRLLLVETARYWASRIERDGDGSAHIRGVIGPDEYHEQVDDNAYTNVMARWNLRRAFVATGDGGADETERARWLELGDALVDGYRPETRLYEQFAGFFALEPLTIARLAPRPIAADLLLGADRVHGAQVVKQADVLMLHHLIPEELAPGSLAPNLDFYEPRTAHASSLSPGIHAGLFARAGRLDEALAALSLAARIDIDDVSDSTAAGVHIAAMGSVWQALAQGFLGLRPHEQTLALDPRLPGEWDALELRLRFRGAQLVVRVTAGRIELSSDRPVRVSLTGAPPVSVDVDGYVAEWEPQDAR